MTPGNFTGYGFDQCLAPTQRHGPWRTSSPFLAVGIYVSGNSRACRDQPNLTKEWVDTQLRKGWRLLPITLGPQASCQPRFPRYDDDPTINPGPAPNGNYSGRASRARPRPIKSVAAAAALGHHAGQHAVVRPRGLRLTNTRCRESALAFLSGWTWSCHRSATSPASTPAPARASRCSTTRG